MLIPFVFKSKLKLKLSYVLQRRHVVTLAHLAGDKHGEQDYSVALANAVRSKLFYLLNTIKDCQLSGFAFGLL